MVSGQEALARLREGNRRFVASLRDTAAPVTDTRRLPLVQEPFAIVLGCSDSRVPAELVFGQGFGDLVVIRVAGNIVAPSQVGSVEFAAARFGTRLAVVLGHTQCGAVVATLEELRQSARHQSPNLRSIVDRIRPSVEPLLATMPDQPPESVLAWSLEPPARLRFQTLPAFVPGGIRSQRSILDEFARLQGELADRMRDASGLDLNQLRIRSVFNARLSYNVYAAFCILLAHERRHLWQGERAARAARS